LPLNTQIYLDFRTLSVRGPLCFYGFLEGCGAQNRLKETGRSNVNRNKGRRADGTGEEGGSLRGVVKQGGSERGGS
jgi:hypothetical protein